MLFSSIINVAILFYLTMLQNRRNPTSILQSRSSYSQLGGKQLPYMPYKSSPRPSTVSRIDSTLLYSSTRFLQSLDSQEHSLGPSRSLNSKVSSLSQACTSRPKGNRRRLSEKGLLLKQGLLQIQLRPRPNFFKRL